MPTIDFDLHGRSSTDLTTSIRRVNGDDASGRPRSVRTIACDDDDDDDGRPGPVDASASMPSERSRFVPAGPAGTPIRIAERDLVPIDDVQRVQVDDGLWKA